jgi:CHASE2 domain-containing sensor protein
MRYEQFANLFSVAAIVCLAFLCYTPIISESVWYPLAFLAGTIGSVYAAIHMETQARKFRKHKRKNDWL